MKPLLAAVLMLVATAFAADTPAAPKNSGPKVDLKAGSAQPRQLEDTTEVAIARDYSVAWKALATALGENRADALDTGFVGVARAKFGKAVDDQNKAGLRRRYTDRGHKLEALFYSPDGSAMQLRDSAQLDVEVLDGNTVVHREQIVQPYLVVMTVAEGSWKVRVLEELPK